MHSDSSISVVVSIPELRFFCCTLAFSMKRITQAVILSNRFQDENQSGANLHPPVISATKADCIETVAFVVLRVSPDAVSDCVAFSLLTGHSCSGLRRYSGPFHQRVDCLMPCADIPRVNKSAGFIFVGEHASIDPYGYCLGCYQFCD